MWLEKERSLQKKCGYALVESLSRILDAVACVINNEGQLIRRSLDLRMSCKLHFEVEGGDFEQLL